MSQILRGCMQAALAAACLSGTAAQASYFERIATWTVADNLPAGVDPSTETVAEIAAVSADGQTVAYTDSEGKALGLLDISSAAAPAGLARIELGGEPTSVVIVGGHALVGVNTSKSFVEPSGHVAVVDIAGRKVIGRCDVKGQPDALAASPDGRFVAIAVENERDEDLDGGAIPQLPAGHLAVLELDGNARASNCDAARIVDLRGLASVAGDDPEPEYVAINSRNQAVVTLQENNHLAIVDLASGEVLQHFSAGSVDLHGIDIERDRRLDFSGSLAAVAREPDAVAWLDDERFVTANEGDYRGGSRGFTIFSMDGSVQFDSGAAIEHLAARTGHYPEKRAGKKGSEPEGVAVGRFGERTLIFVGSERANLIAVYEDMGAGQAPRFVQVLPTGVAPEGIVAAAARNLLVVSAEKDDAKEGIRSTVALYRLGAGRPAYPTIVSENDAASGGSPIGWGALSGLAGNPSDPTLLYAVHDSFYADSRIYLVDVSSRPARIVGQRPLSKDGQPVDYDLEGIATAADGGFWLVSEGNPEKAKSNLLIKTSARGVVEQEVRLPRAVDAQAKRFGFEGVASVVRDGREQVVVAFQREWNDDPQRHVRIGVYDPASGAWGFVHYPIEAPLSAAGGWVGLSEIVALGGAEFAVLERDNRKGPDAALKRVYRVNLAGVTPAAAGATAPVLGKTLMLDLMPALRTSHGWVADKPEGLTVAADGRMYLVTDNDGVDDATGETQFIDLGTVKPAD